MNPLLTAAKFCSKDSLQRLTKFHADLVTWAAQMQESGQPDNQTFYASADEYLTFLKDLGVLEEMPSDAPS